MFESPLFNMKLVHSRTLPFFQGFSAWAVGISLLIITTTGTTTTTTTTTNHKPPPPPAPPPTQPQKELMMLKANTSSSNMFVFFDFQSDLIWLLNPRPRRIYLAFSGTSWKLKAKIIHHVVLEKRWWWNIILFFPRNPTGPSERTPKPEHLIALANLLRGPLGFGPIQFLMDSYLKRKVVWYGLVTSNFSAKTLHSDREGLHLQSNFHTLRTKEGTLPDPIQDAKTGWFSLGDSLHFPKTKHSAPQRRNLEICNPKSSFQMCHVFFLWCEGKRQRNSLQT